MALVSIPPMGGASSSRAGAVEKMLNPRRNSRAPVRRRAALGCDFSGNTAVTDMSNPIQPSFGIGGALVNSFGYVTKLAKTTVLSL